MPVDPHIIHRFGAPYAYDDAAIAMRLLQSARLAAAQEASIDRTATRLIEAIRPMTIRSASRTCSANSLSTKGPG